MLRSPYSELALRKIQQALGPNARELLSSKSGAPLLADRRQRDRLHQIMRSIIDGIDTQMQDHLGAYEAAAYSASLPYTWFSLNDVVTAAFDAALPATGRQEVRFILTSFGFQPFPTPQFASDWAYDDAFANLGKVVAGTCLAFYVVGLPYGLGGAESHALRAARQTQGFEPYGTMVAELVQHVLPEAALAEHQTRLRIHGFSLSAQIAHRAYNHLPPAYRSRTYVIKDNPVAQHAPTRGIPIRKRTLSLPGLRVPLGFGLEAIARGLMDPTSRAMAVGQRAYLLRLRNYLGIEDTKEQRRLRVEAQNSDILNMIQGAPLPGHEAHVKTRVGVWDLTSLTWHGVRKHITRMATAKPRRRSPVLPWGVKSRAAVPKAGTGGHRLKAYEYTIVSGHFINRFHTGKWIRRTLSAMRRLSGS